MLHSYFHTRNYANDTNKHTLTQMKMRQEESQLHEKAAVQAALANVRAERIKEEEEERVRMNPRAFGARRPVTAPQNRGIRARIWGNHLQEVPTNSDQVDFNFWAKVR